MIRINDRLLTLDIVPPQSERMHYSKSFAVLRGIIDFRGRNFPGTKSNGVFDPERINLREHHSDSIFRRITRNDKRTRKIREGKSRCVRELILELVKSSLTFGGPVNFCAVLFR